MVVSYVLIHACNLGHVRNGHTSLGAFFASEGGGLRGKQKEGSVMSHLHAYVYAGLRRAYMQRVIR